jgi:hypothetical protein
MRALRVWQGTPTQTLYISTAHLLDVRPRHPPVHQGCWPVGRPGWPGRRPASRATPRRATPHSRPGPTKPIAPAHPTTQVHQWSRSRPFRCFRRPRGLLPLHTGAQVYTPVAVSGAHWQTRTPHPPNRRALPPSIDQRPPSPPPSRRAPARLARRSATVSAQLRILPSPRHPM